jgi:two-component system sensor histidine kinase BaeS
MRSISLKITLVLVIVSLVGVVFGAFYIHYRTQKAFDTFIRNQDQSVMVELLTDYYLINNDWSGIEEIFSEFYQMRFQGGPGGGYQGNNPNRPNQNQPLAPFVLADPAGKVIAGESSLEGYQIGDIIPQKDLKKNQPLEFEGQAIGWIVAVPNPQARNDIQQNFLGTVQQGLVISSLISLLIALLLGGYLIQSFTRPIRKLVNATEAVSGGNLGYQVDISSKDELGRLAASFNSMSADLEKADQSRKQMTADIAHDLRTPLSILAGYTEALSDGKLAGNQEIFQTMHQQARHLNYLIDDLRTLTLLDSNELNFQLQEIDPGKIIRQAREAFLPMASEKGIQFSLDIKEDLPRIKLDPDRLTQILGNLIHNALKVLPAGGEISLAGSSAGDQLQILVSDNGPGISPQDIPFIFTRFFRADKSRQSDQGSSGLGLAITKKLVEAQGGKVEVESQEGKGTTFKLSFPITSPDGLAN